MSQIKLAIGETHIAGLSNGHNDIMAPTVNSFILQQKRPDARLMPFPDFGHGAHFQFAEEFAEAATHLLAAD